MKTPRPRRHVHRSSSPAPPVGSAYRLPNDDLEKALVTGALADELTQYFGEDGYEELAGLAREAAQRGLRRGAERVLILPGIMGTKLGREGGGLFGLDDVIWLDPKDIVLGRLAKLKLGPGAGAKIAPLGAMLLFYLKLKLRLRSAGFDAECWGYDWRHGVPELGAQLVTHLRGLPAKVHLVAHSMGGLVARAALKQGAARAVNRLVMLGTPNHGSFMPTQAVRGTLDTIRTLARFDPVHTPEELCAEVFNTFPSVYQLLPSPQKYQAFDLFDPAAWPPDGPQPVPGLLRAARDLPDQLAPANDHTHLIAGVNQDTVTGLERVDHQFSYAQSREGDGTVPLAFAQLEGASTHYVDESHGSLPNHPRVARAVADLLRTGQTSELPTSWTSARGGVRRLDETQLRARVSAEKRPHPPSPAEARDLLSRFVSASAQETETAPTAAPAASPAAELHFNSLVVGRRRQHRLDIGLAQGDITQTSARAVVLGLFREVTPTGAARAVDARMNGALSEIIGRRMFSGNIGEVFLLPTGRYPVRADLVLFAGLGTFDTFQNETLGLVAENTVRTLIRTDVEDFATVLLGGGSGQTVALSLEFLLRGFIRGLLDADRDFRFRRITLCENDPARFAELRQELYRLAGTSLLEEVEVTFDERLLPPAEPAPDPARGVTTIAARSPNYLIVRQDSARGDRLVFRSSILTAGAKATVLTGQKPVSARALQALLAELETPQFTPTTLPHYGSRLGKLLLADELLEALPTLADRHLVVVHDAPASRIPWETLTLGGRFPAVTQGVSRRYLADNLSVAKWLEDRRQQPTLDVLLVVNPTQDLPGAELEGDRIRKMLTEGTHIQITVRQGAQATKTVLESDFRSGKYDLVHYAGHAFFDPVEPARSGILCAGQEVLSGAELAGLGNLPNLVVFNACEAGRIRGGVDRKKRRLDMARRVERTVGLAEAFLRGGIANYVGTYWPVGDAPAERFAGVFYGQLLRGESIGSALRQARTEVQALQPATVDWADYLHYGDFNFTLKQRT